MKLIDWVLPGVELVFAMPRRFSSLLIREDLPTLERPAKAISGRSSAGRPVSLEKTFIKLDPGYFHVTCSVSRVKMSL